MSLSPPLLKAGLVLLDPITNAVRQVIAFQYNSDSLTRSLLVPPSGEEGERSEVLRMRGPSAETLKLELEIDAPDLVGTGEPNLEQLGIHPRIAAFEGLLQPTVEQLQANDALARSGTLELVPMEAPLVLFVFGRNRVVPVRVTEFTVTEEAFDPNLNPIRAKVSLGLRVLTVDDVPSGHRAGSLFMAYLQLKQGFGALGARGTLGALGLTGVP